MDEQVVRFYVEPFTLHLNRDNDLLSPIILILVLVPVLVPDTVSMTTPLTVWVNRCVNRPQQQNINGQCPLPSAYLTTPVCPSDAFQSMVLLHAPVCTSQNLRLQSSDPLTIRRSSNCKHVTASWCPGNVITHAPSNVHSCNRMPTMRSCCTEILRD